jgi:hypothetical protein
MRNMNRLKFPLICCVLLSLLGCARKIEGQAFIVTQGRENVKLGLLKIEIYDRNELRKFLNEYQEKSKIRLREIGKSVMENFEKIEKLKEEEATNSRNREDVRRVIKALEEEFNNLNQLSTYADNPIANKTKEKMGKVRENILVTDNILRVWDNNLQDIEDKREKLLNENAGLHKEAVAISIYWLANITMPTLETTYTDADGKFAITHTDDSVILLAQGSRSVAGGEDTYTWLLSPRSRTPLFLSNDNLIKPEDITADKL